MWIALIFYYIFRNELLFESLFGSVNSTFCIFQRTTLFWHPSRSIHTPSTCFPSSTPMNKLNIFRLVKKGKKTVLNRTVTWLVACILWRLTVLQFTCPIFTHCGASLPVLRRWWRHDTCLELELDQLTSHTHAYLHVASSLNCHSKYVLFGHLLSILLLLFYLIYVTYIGIFVS